MAKTLDIGRLILTGNLYTFNVNLEWITSNICMLHVKYIN